MTCWTAERVELLKSGHAAGRSFSMIAAEISEDSGKRISRNAVIGKAKRLGLPARKISVPFEIKIKVKKEKRSPRLQHWLQTLPVEAKPVLVRLLDLQPHHCRFPLGDPRDESFRFCGANKEDGHSYCGAHLRLICRSDDQESGHADI